MTSFLFIPLIYAASVVQMWCASRWDAFGAGPDLLVLIGFLWLTKMGSRRGLMLAALAGLALDLNSPTPLGLNLALFATAAYGIVWLRRRLNLDGFPAQLGVLWFAATSITFWQGLFVKCFERSSVTWAMLIQRSALVGLYTMCVAVPILIFIFWRRTPREQFA